APSDPQASLLPPLITWASASATQQLRRALMPSGGHPRRLEPADASALIFGSRGSLRRKSCLTSACFIVKRHMTDLWFNVNWHSPASIATGLMLDPTLRRPS